MTLREPVATAAFGGPASPHHVIVTPAADGGTLLAQQPRERGGEQRPDGDHRGELAERPRRVDGEGGHLDAQPATEVTVARDRLSMRSCSRASTTTSVAWKAP